MKLSQEDYENIWLRFKDKSKYWLFAWASFLTFVASVIVGFGINNYITNRADIQIQALINSDVFRNDVLAKLKEDIIKNNKSLSDLVEKNTKLYDELRLRIKNIEALKEYPIKCNEHGFEIINSDGKSIKFEYGHGLANDRVENYFRSSFKYPPSVFLTRTNSPSSQLTYGAKKAINLATEVITTKYFKVRYDIGSYTLIEYSWIAVGQ